MRSIFLVLFIVLVSSCGKVFKTTVKGRVLNPVTGTGIENARVILQKAGSGIPSGLKTVEAVYSDANGNFEISARKLKSLTASVILDGNEYYSIGWKEGGNDYSELSPKKGETTEADFHAVPYSNSKLIINNTSCLGSSDTLILYRSNQINSIDGAFGWVHTGCVYWETNGYSKIPMGNVYYHWVVKKNGVTTNYYDTVFYNAGESKIYTLEY